MLKESFILKEQKLFLKGWNSSSELLLVYFCLQSLMGMDVLAKSVVVKKVCMACKNDRRKQNLIEET